MYITRVLPYTTFYLGSGDDSSDPTESAECAESESSRHETEPTAQTTTYHDLYGTPHPNHTSYFRSANVVSFIARFPRVAQKERPDVTDLIHARPKRDMPINTCSGAF